VSFGASKFQHAEYAPRMETVPMPVLVEFFGEGEAAEFTVRGLTASELNKAHEAGNRQKNLDAVVKAIASQKEQVAEIRKALGLSADTPGEIAKRMEMLVAGSVEPKLDHATVAKLAEVFPVEFYDLSNRITNLTGQGASRVKPPASSPATPASSRRSSSAKRGGASSTSTGPTCSPRAG
jgi:hypothetical protein